MYFAINILSLIMCANAVLRSSGRINTDSVSIHSARVCGGEYNLSPPLLVLCKEHPLLFENAIKGFTDGLYECQAMFSKHRWNCTAFDVESKFQLLGTIMARGSREAAVQMAIISAGMVDSITAIFATNGRENLSLQNANTHITSRQCDSDLKLGNTFSKNLLKSWQPQVNSAELQMNEHNAAVGRLAVCRNMKKVCPCSGVSGSCATRFCYMALKPLPVSLDWLYKQYDRAQKVRRGPQRNVRRDGRRLLINNNDEIPLTSDLIYLIDSPDYCQNDINLNSLGTRGRKCSNDSTSMDNCSHMCCSRGFRTKSVVREVSCNCEFKWCCTVHCQRCSETVQVHECN